MTAVVKIEEATLYLGDARDIVGGLEKAALVVTDPPYEVASGGAGKGHLSGKFGGDYKNDGKMVHCDISWPEVMELVRDACLPTADIYAMSDDKNLTDAMVAARAAGLKHHRHLVWDKGAGTPNRWYMKSAEFVMYLFKGSPRTINQPGSLQVIKMRRGLETAHRTEKPVLLMQHLIEMSSDPGDLVIDPFMGSGTTGVAAVQAGRRFVGIEEIPEWFDVAVTRISAASKDSRFFSESA